MKVVIGGGGPAGLATGDHLQSAGHEVVILEKGPIASNITRYPTYLTWFSTSDLLEIGGLPLTIAADKPTRQDYLAYLTRLVEYKHLDVRTYHELTSIEGKRGAFSVGGRTMAGDDFAEQTDIVILATGAYDHPRMLNIPGEDLPKVSHYYKEPHPYHKQKVLVVGGRNSAVEATLEIWRIGGIVSLAYWKDDFPTSVKYWIRPDIENRIEAGEITGYMPSEVLSIQPKTVTLRYDGEEITIENDFVLALTGYEPDTAFMEELGIGFDPETKRPNLDPETYETNVPGIYIVGVIQAGNISSEIFIENSRHHGGVIVEALESQTLLETQ